MNYHAELRPGWRRLQIAGLTIVRLPALRVIFLKTRRGPARVRVEIFRLARPAKLAGLVAIRWQHLVRPARALLEQLDKTLALARVKFFIDGFADVAQLGLHFRPHDFPENLPVLPALLENLLDALVLFGAEIVRKSTRLNSSHGYI